MFVTSCACVGRIGMSGGMECSRMVAGCLTVATGRGAVEFEEGIQEK